MKTPRQVFNLIQKQYAENSKHTPSLNEALMDAECAVYEDLTPQERKAYLAKREKLWAHRVLVLGGTISTQ